MANPYHKPAGSPEGGEFTSGPDAAVHALGYKHGKGRKRYSPPESEKGKGISGAYHQGYEAGQLDRIIGADHAKLTKAYGVDGRRMADDMARKLSPITWGGKK